VSAPNPPSATTPQVFFRRSYLWVLAVLAFAYGFVAVLVPVPAVELPLGLVTLLLTPGYALGAIALGPTTRWPWSLTFAMVVGLSVAFSVLEGLVLLAFHLGLPAAVFAIVSLGLVVIALATFPVEAPESAAETRFRHFVAEELRLPGHSPGQRVVAVAILLAIVVVFAGIIYLATVTPNQHPSIQMGIVGPNGLTSDLPATGVTLVNLTVEVMVGNSPTQQALNLVVLSYRNNTAPTSYSNTAWKLPLALGNNTTSLCAFCVKLTPKATTTVPVIFVFRAPGTYVVVFDLESQSGGVLQRNSFLTTIVP
jgi:uncharacterized membrane protein